MTAKANLSKLKRSPQHIEHQHVPEVRQRQITKCTKTVGDSSILTKNIKLHNYGCWSCHEMHYLFAHILRFTCTKRRRWPRIDRVWIYWKFTSSFLFCFVAFCWFALPGSHFPELVHKYCPPSVEYVMKPPPSLPKTTTVDCSYCNNSSVGEFLEQIEFLM